MRVVLVQQDDMPFAQIAAPENSGAYVVNNHKVGLQTRKYQEYLFSRLDPAEKTDFLEDRGFKKPLVAKGIALVKGAISWTKETVASLFSGDESGDALAWEREQFIKKINLAASVEDMKESHVIRVSVKGPNRDLAASLANQYAQLYASYLADTERGSARANFEFLQQSEEEYRKLAVESRQTLNKFRIENDVMDPVDTQGIVNDEVKRLNEERARVRVNFTTAEAVLLQVERLRDSGKSLLTIDEIAKEERVQAAYKRLGEKQAAYSAALSLYGELNTKTRQAAEEIKALQNFINVEAEQAVERFSNTLESSEQRLKTLDGELEKVLNHVLEHDKKAVELANLVARANSDQKTYDQILAKLNEAKVEMEIPHTSQIEVIDHAVPAEKAYRPNKPLSVIISGFLFMSMFVGLPLFLGLSQDMSRRFGIRIPYVHRDLPEDIGSIPQMRSTTPMQMLAEAFAPGGGREDLFKIATRIDKKHSTDETPITLVTSAESGEGKSFLAAALGGVYCSQGRKVLIIDANFHAPTMSLLFPQLGGRANIIDWLESDGAADLKLEDLRHGASDLFILPAHGWAMEPAKLLTKPCFAQLLRFAAEDFDAVILDGPKVNGSNEAEILARHATSIVMAGDRRLSEYRQLSEAHHRLQEVAPDKLVGLVTNRIDQPPL